VSGPPSGPRAKPIGPDLNGHGVHPKEAPAPPDILDPKPQASRGHFRAYTVKDPQGPARHRGTLGWPRQSKVEDRGRCFRRFVAKLYDA